MGSIPIEDKGVLSKFVMNKIVIKVKKLLLFFILMVNIKEYIEKMLFL